MQIIDQGGNVKNMYEDVVDAAFMFDSDDEGISCLMMKSDGKRMISQFAPNPYVRVKK